MSKLLREQVKGFGKIHCPIVLTGASPGEMVSIFDIMGRIASESIIGDIGASTVDITNLKVGLYTVISGTSVARFTVTAR